MKKFLLMLAVVLMQQIFLVSMSFAEIKTYTGVEEYVMSEGENLGTAKERAKQKALRNIQEQAGIFISSYSKMKNFDLVEDEIVTMSGGILKVSDVQYETTVLNNATGISIRATVTATVDTEDVNKYFEKGISERQEISAKVRDLQKANEEQDRKIEELKNLLNKSQTPEEKEEIFEEIGRQDKIFLSNLRTEVAFNFNQKKDYERAIEFANEAIELNPKNAKAYNERGAAYSWLGKNDEALADYNKAIEFDDNDEVYFTNRGNTHMFFKDYDKGISDYKRAIELDSNYSLAYSGLCGAYNDKNNYDEAIKYGTKAIELDKNNYVAYNNRGWAYLGSKKYEQAIADFEKSIELNEESEHPYVGLGQCYYCLKKYEQAIENYTKAIRINSENAVYYNNRGVAYSFINMHGKSVSDYTKAIKLDPNYAQAYHNRGNSYTWLNQWDKARADWKKAKKLGFKK